MNQKEQILLSYGQGSAWYDLSEVDLSNFDKEVIEKAERRFVEIYDPANTFQLEVDKWMIVCFGKEIAGDIVERNHRFFEEATELVQSTGMTKRECYQLVDYVFSREIGNVNQEIGGVMVTLSALCSAEGLDMNKAGETELKRIWTKVEVIRAKQAAKPKHSALPVPTVNRYCYDCVNGKHDHCASNNKQQKCCCYNDDTKPVIHSMFMAGGNTDAEKDFYQLGYNAGKQDAGGAVEVVNNIEAILKSSSFGEQSFGWYKEQMITIISQFKQQKE